MSTDPFATHHRGILEELGSLSEQSKPFTLCVVVHSTGSTYRKAGALAIVGGDGARRGVISGGCLESDLELAATGVLQKDRPRLVVFDTRTDDDVVFGSGSGCRGRMQVLLLPVQAGAKHPLCEALVSADLAQQTLKAALVTSGQHVGSGFVWYADIEMELAPRVELAHGFKNSVPGEYPLADDSSCAVLAVAPTPRIMLVGAGPEAPALIHITGELGWRVTISDHREAQLRTRGAGAERTICAPPADALAALTAQRFDACIVMTHTAANDRAALAALATRGDRFVGLLGPPARRDELLNELDSGARAALAARLHAPVGLKLGGYGPEALALSICAELQQFLANTPDSVATP